MTGHIARSITCDIGLPNDPFGCEEYHGTWHTLAQLREEAATLGWTHRGDKDFCPDHSNRVAQEGGNRG